MSDLRRFFCENIQPETQIEGEEFLHAVNVLRIKEGEDIILLNNTEFEYTAKVSKINKKSFICEVLKKNANNNENKYKIKLICGFLKGDKTELIVQKAVELGVSEIVVFESQFSSAYLSDKKVERLIKVAKEAAKQCKRSKYPKITSEKYFKKAISDCEYNNKIIACEFAEKSDIQLSEIKGDTAVIIGSEGGFSENEAKTANEMGYKSITLGKRILRAETACITMCSLIAFLNGDLQ